MKKEWRVIAFVSVLAALAIIASCKPSGPDNDDNDDPNPNPVDDSPSTIADPKSATLIFPENNKECTEGSVANEDDLTSRITFQWNPAEDADSYTITVINLTNSNDQELADVSTVQVFEWFVTSKAKGTNATATSAMWRFYNQGPGIENYAPFPAQAVSPARGATVSGTTVTLSWNGEDVDGDIVDYEVFIDTSDDPTESQGITTSESLENFSVTSGMIYNWKVVTRDSAGNTSTSEIFQFRVE